MTGVIIYYAVVLDKRIDKDNDCIIVGLIIMYNFYGLFPNIEENLFKTSLAARTGGSD